MNSDSNVDLLDYDAMGSPMNEAGGTTEGNGNKTGTNGATLTVPAATMEESVMDSVMERELAEVDMSEIDAVTNMWEDEEEVGQSGKTQPHQI